MERGPGAGKVGVNTDEVEVRAVSRCVGSGSEVDMCGGDAGAMQCVRGLGRGRGVMESGSDECLLRVDEAGLRVRTGAVGRGVLVPHPGDDPLLDVQRRGEPFDRAMDRRVVKNQSRAPWATTPRRIPSLASRAVRRRRGVGATRATWSSRSRTCRAQRTKSPAARSVSARTMSNPNPEAQWNIG